ncbi:MAG: glycosyltransferase family 4 protein [Verrucomicrobiota bacterium]
MISKHKATTNVSLVFRHFHPILAGAAERFRRYSIPLAKEGLTFQTYTLRESAEHPEEETLHAALQVHRITAEGGAWQRDAVLFQRAFEALSRAPGHGQVLQTSLAHGLARPWLKRARSRGVGCLYVGTMVGDDDAPAPLWRRVLQRWRMRQDYAPFNTLVASTGVMAKWFEQRGIRKDRIEIIPNGVDTTRFKPVADAREKAALRAELGIPLEAKLVTFVGSIVPRKGVDLLLRSWPETLAHHPEARLALVGGFERPTFMTQDRIAALTEYQNGVRALAESADMRGSVQFVPETPAVEKWLRAADVFVFPSEQEGMGNVVLEAMACGLPSVITRFKGLPEGEFGDPGCEFHLVPRTEADLTAGLRTALADAKQGEIMGKHARAWIMDRMDLRLTLARYAQLYHRLGHRH